MSTLKVTKLQHPDAASAAVELESDGSIGGFLGDELASKLDLAGGKILQIVRATDNTNRSTTSTSVVDVTGMSVTITPQKSDSEILVVASVSAQTLSSTAGNHVGVFLIRDASDNVLQGTSSSAFGNNNYSFSGTAESFHTLQIIGRDTPATLSAVTYKLSFSAVVSSTTITVRNVSNLGQIFAIEVSA